MVTMERVDENTRAVSNGTQKWFVKRVNGLDLWEIKTDKGPVPRALEGMYTDPNYAKQAVENYVSLRKPKE